MALGFLVVTKLSSSYKPEEQTLQYGEANFNVKGRQEG